MKQLPDSKFINIGTTSHSFRPFGDHKEELPDMCIHCNSRLLKLTKKLPRTFICSNKHSFNIGEFRKNKLNKKVVIENNNSR